MRLRSTFLPARLALSLGSALFLLSVPGHAADLDYQAAPPPLVEGADCADAPALPWPTVWLGHFSGGNSYYDRRVGQIALAWVDQKLCFPSRAACDHWIAPLRRTYHRPESYWTCLPLR